jgi:hypothetical protein
MAKSEDNLNDLTVALKGLVENLNDPEQRRVNNTNVSPQQLKPDKLTSNLTSAYIAQQQKLTNQVYSYFDLG